MPLFLISLASRKIEILVMPLSKDQAIFSIDTGGVGSEITEFSEAITEQALIAAEDSNLILFLIDGSEELTSDDINLFQFIRK